jgi:hypothetical protein
MPCVICGDTKTVNSHIIPKSFTLDIRGDGKHAIVGSRNHVGFKTSQSGDSDGNLLCHSHELMTQNPDKYAIEFVRLANAIWQKNNSDREFFVANPHPDRLTKFALTTIWRESVRAGGFGKHALGPYRKRIEDFIFYGGPALDTPVYAFRTQHTAKEHGPINYNLYPHRLKFLNFNSWRFVVSGMSFYVILDNRVSEFIEDFRVDQNNPARILVMDSKDISTLGTLKPILRNMRLQ